MEKKVSKRDKTMKDFEELCKDLGLLSRDATTEEWKQFYDTILANVKKWETIFKSVEER